MLLDDLARELVAYTSEIVGGRTINIMNREGIIIASTEEHRVGSFHQGALEVIRTGKPVAIEPDQVEFYPGAKQGYNMPIRIDGEIIGVIGIFGTPSEIEPLAKLLEVFAVKYYQLEAMATPRLAEMELRTRLLKSLLYLTESTEHNARMLMKELQVNPEFPSVIAVMSPLDPEPDSTWTQDLPALLQDKKLISESKDLWGVVNDRLVILSAGVGFPKAISSSGLLIPEGPYTVSIGDVCNDIRSISKSFEQALILNRSTTLAYADIADAENRALYLLNFTAQREEKFFEKYLRLLEQIPQSELLLLFQSISAYYEESHSIERASKKLFVHKNTLQYRIKRLESTLGIQDRSAFEKEYLIRILMECYKSKQGLRTLI